MVAYLEAREHSDMTKMYLSRLVNFFKDVRLIDITQYKVDEAYKHVLRDGIHASPATKIRGVLTPLKAVLEFSAIRKWCDRPAFERPKIPKNRTVFLKPDEVVRIISEASEHLKPLLIFLAGTGVRVSEALELEWKDVDLTGRVAVVWQKQGTERFVNLPPVIMQMLERLPHRSGRVFRPQHHGKVGAGYYDSGRNSGGQFKKGWAGACKRAGMPGRERVWVPKGQKSERRQFVPEYTPHSLRHTWATWHYCLHHDLLLLKEEGGWDTIAIVTRYAKKMPDVYAVAIQNFLDGRSLAQNVPTTLCNKL